MSKQSPLTNAVKQSVASFYSDLGDEKVSGMYHMVVNAVEKVLIEAVLKRSEGNQSIAARALGINRNTLRAKMKKFGIL